MPFPNVPNVPGVPPLLRDPSSFSAPPRPLSEDQVTSFGQPDSVQWGLFKDGESVITADSVQAFEFRREWGLPDYPLEKGAFESYNKVISPYAARVRFASGSSESSRTALLETVEEVAGSLDLFDCVTPEKTFANVNVEHYDFRRTSDKGVGMIQIDLWLVEIRVNASESFTTVKSPAAADSVNSGTVQTKAPTTTQTSKSGQVQ